MDDQLGWRQWVPWALQSASTRTASDWIRPYRPSQCLGQLQPTVHRRPPLEPLLRRPRPWGRPPQWLPQPPSPAPESSPQGPICNVTSHTQQKKKSFPPFLLILQDKDKFDDDKATNCAWHIHQHCNVNNLETNRHQISCVFHFSRRQSQLLKPEYIRSRWDWWR